MINEPLDTGLVRHFLEFVNDNEGRIEIAEPVKFDASNFVFEQEKSRYGRDVSYASGTIELEFYDKVQNRGLSHEFDRIIYYFNTFRFEAEIKYILQINGIDYVIGILDFVSTKHDQVSFAQCRVIQESDFAVIDRRKDVKVDLFSDRNLNNEAITPVQSQKLLIKSLDSFDISSWFLQSNESYNFPASSLGAGNLEFFFNPFISSTKFQIKNTLIPSRTEVAYTGSLIPYADGFVYLSARNSLRGLKIKLNNISLIVRNNTGVWDSRNQVNLAILAHPKGFRDIIPDYPKSRIIDLLPFGSVSGQEFKATIDQEFEIPFEVTQAEELSVLFQTSLRDGSELSFTYDITVESNGGNIDISATSTPISSVTRAIRLIDAMKQVCKSINNYNVIAPRWEVGGEFYDQVIFNGNLLRGFQDTSFYVSLEDILEIISEVHGDYQINGDGTIFFGIYDDFYRNELIETYDIGPIDPYEESFNPRYTVNQFLYEYDKFEEDRDEEKTAFSVHTKSEWLLPNKNVENIKEVKVKAIRDTFYIDSIRKKSIIVEEDKSLQEDNDIFICDTVALLGSTVITEEAILTHSVLDNGNLSLANDSTFTWESLGIRTGDIFTLNNVNNGTYTVSSINGAFLELSGSTTKTDQEAISTSFSFTPRNVNLKIRESEGFDVVNNIPNTGGFANLKFTQKRNILNYYGSYLSTCCDVRQNETILNTFFKNNKKLQTSTDDSPVTIEEGSDIQISELKDRILTPVMVKTSTVAKFEKVMNTINNLVKNRGFIRIKNNTDQEIDIYPTRINYTWATNLLEIEGEQRFINEPILDITSSNGIVITKRRGKPEKVHYGILFKIQDRDVKILDTNSLLLEEGIKFFDIRVNGKYATTIEELAVMLGEI